MKRVRLDQHALEIQLDEERPGQGDLGTEYRFPAGGGLNGVPERHAITNWLIKIRCPAWDLGDPPH